MTAQIQNKDRKVDITLKIGQARQPQQQILNSQIPANLLISANYMCQKEIESLQKQNDFKQEITEQNSDSKENTLTSSNLGSLNSKPDLQKEKSASIIGPFLNINNTYKEHLNSLQTANRHGKVIKGLNFASSVSPKKSPSKTQSKSFQNSSPYDLKNGQTHGKNYSNKPQKCNLNKSLYGDLPESSKFAPKTSMLAPQVNPKLIISSKSVEKMPYVLCQHKSFLKRHNSAQAHHYSNNHLLRRSSHSRDHQKAAKNDLNKSLKFGDQKGRNYFSNLSPQKVEKDDNWQFTRAAQFSRASLKSSQITFGINLRKSVGKQGHKKMRERRQKSKNSFNKGIGARGLNFDKNSETIKQTLSSSEDLNSSIQNHEQALNKEMQFGIQTDYESGVNLVSHSFAQFGVHSALQQPIIVSSKPRNIQKVNHVSDGKRNTENLNSSVQNLSRNFSSFPAQNNLNSSLFIDQFHQNKPYGPKIGINCRQSITSSLSSQQKFQLQSKQSKRPHTSTHQSHTVLNNFVQTNDCQPQKVKDQFYPGKILSNTRNLKNSSSSKHRRKDPPLLSANIPSQYQASQLDLIKAILTENDQYNKSSSSSMVNMDKSSHHHQSNNLYMTKKILNRGSLRRVAEHNNSYHILDQASKNNGNDFRKSLPVSMAKGIPEPTSELRERLPQNFFNISLTNQRHGKMQNEKDFSVETKTTSQEDQQSNVQKQAKRQAQKFYKSQKQLLQGKSDLKNFESKNRLHIRKEEKQQKGCTVQNNDQEMGNLMLKDDTILDQKAQNQIHWLHNNHFQSKENQDHQTLRQQNFAVEQMGPENDNICQYALSPQNVPAFNLNQNFDQQINQSAEEENMQKDLQQKLNLNQALNNQPNLLAFFVQEESNSQPSMLSPEVTAPYFLNFSNREQQILSAHSSSQAEQQNFTPTLIPQSLVQNKNQMKNVPESNQILPDYQLLSQRLRTELEKGQEKVKSDSFRADGGCTDEQAFGQLENGQKLVSSTNSDNPQLHLNPVISTKQIESNYISCNMIGRSSAIMQNDCKERQIQKNEPQICSQNSLQTEVQAVPKKKTILRKKPLRRAVTSKNQQINTTNTSTSIQTSQTPALAAGLDRQNSIDELLMQSEQQMIDELEVDYICPLRIGTLNAKPNVNNSPSKNADLKAQFKGPKIRTIVGGKAISEEDVQWQVSENMKNLSSLLKVPISSRELVLTNNANQGLKQHKRASLKKMREGSRSAKYSSLSDHSSKSRLSQVQSRANTPLLHARNHAAIFQKNLAENERETPKGLKESKNDSEEAKFNYQGKNLGSCKSSKEIMKSFVFTGKNVPIQSKVPFVEPLSAKNHIQKEDIENDLKVQSSLKQELYQIDKGKQPKNTILSLSKGNNPTNKIANMSHQCDNDTEQRTDNVQKSQPSKSSFEVKISNGYSLGKISAQIQSKKQRNLNQQQARKTFVSVQGQQIKQSENNNVYQKQGKRNQENIKLAKMQENGAISQNEQQSLQNSTFIEKEDQKLNETQTLQIGIENDTKYQPQKYLQNLNQPLKITTHSLEVGRKNEILSSQKFQQKQWINQDLIHSEQVMTPQEIPINVVLQKLGQINPSKQSQLPQMVPLISKTPQNFDKSILKSDCDIQVNQGPLQSTIVSPEKAKISPKKLIITESQQNMANIIQQQKQGEDLIQGQFDTQAKKSGQAKKQRIQIKMNAAKIQFELKDELGAIISNNETSMPYLHSGYQSKKQLLFANNNQVQSQQLTAPKMGMKNSKSQSLQSLSSQESKNLGGASQQSQNYNLIPKTTKQKPQMSKQIDKKSLKKPMTHKLIGQSQSSVINPFQKIDKSLISNLLPKNFDGIVQQVSFETSQQKVLKGNALPEDHFTRKELANYEGK